MQSADTDKSSFKVGASDENGKTKPGFKKQRPKPARRPLGTESDWQPPTSSEYPPNTATAFRHGFRPPASQNGYNRFNRNPDMQRSSVQNSGRFQPRGGGRGGQTQGYKLRAPRSDGGVSFQSGGPGQPRHHPNKQGMHRHASANGATANNRPQSDNYTKSLEEYFSQMNLGSPEFKTSKMEKKVSVGGRLSKKGTTMKYCSSVKVNNQRFQTYPNEYNTEQEAEEAAAKLACENLGIGTPGSLPFAPGVATSSTPSQMHTVTSDSIDTIIERVFNLVSNRPNGVWSNKVETEYEEKFGHGLPENWPTKIELHQSSGRSQRMINVEKPIPDRAIIMPCIEVPKLTKHSDCETSSTNQASAPEYSSSNLLFRGLPMTKPPPSFVVQPQPKLPELMLPEENIWDVYVTHIFSTVEVCVRLLGDEYSTVYEDLITEMELHYYDASKIPQVNNPIVGRMYAAVLDNNEVHRVEVVSVKGIEVTCYFMDHGGDHVTLDLRSLREIDPKFLKLAAQAKKVRLAGLEGFAQNQTAHNELINAALARSLVAQVHSRNSDGDISLILVDTSGQEKDVNINEKLLKELRELPSSPLSPMVNKSLSTNVVSPPRVASPGSPSLNKTPVVGPTESDLMSIDLASLKPLILPEVPGPEQFFDVNITLAASPSNFTVQPYKDTTELERLMASMRDFYGDEKKRITLTNENLSKDIYFAALHTDGSWYRVKINSQLDSCTLAAKLVDYGEFSMLPIHNMQPLWPQFRNLPMQAISATLNKIVGANGDWSTEDTVWFARRVVNKSFVSIIKAVTFDDIEQNYKISVSLADTSDPTEDVYIEHELINSGRALPLCD